MPLQHEEPVSRSPDSKALRKTKPNKDRRSNSVFVYCAVHPVFAARKVLCVPARLRAAKPGKPYSINHYTTGDGTRRLLFAIQPVEDWPPLRRTLGQEDLTADARFASIPARTGNRAEPVALAGPSVQLASAVKAKPRPTPEAGEHTASALCSLGYDEKAIEELSQ